MQLFETETEQKNWNIFLRKLVTEKKTNHRHLRQMSNKSIIDMYVINIRV